MKIKKGAYPTKRSMNLFYKPDRTTRPATIALYVLFVLVCLLGLSKLLVYDLWDETRQAEAEAAAEQARFRAVMEELSDYNEVRERYNLYSATEEEDTLVDRMEVLALVESVTGGVDKINTVSVSGGAAQLQISGITLADAARIVRELEASPIVAGTTVNTAATTEDSGDQIQASVFIQLQKEGTEP